REAWRRVDIAAKPHHSGDLVEIAERGLELGQNVDGAGSGGLDAFIDRYPTAELALGDQFAFGIQAELAGYHHEVPGADEWHVVGDGSDRFRQHDPQFSELLFHSAGHMVLLRLPPESWTWGLHKSAAPASRTSTPARPSAGHPSARQIVAIVFADQGKPCK